MTRGTRLWAEPHHDGSALHSPEAAAATLGDVVPVLLRVPHAGPGVQAVHVRRLHDGEPFYTAAEVVRRDEHDTWWQARLPLRNRMTHYRWLLDDGPDGYRWVNAAGTWSHDVTDAADFVVSTYRPAPDWAVDGVVYQVFPDRFARSGVDHGPLPDWAVPAEWGDPVEHTGPETPLQLFGGDLAGVEQHLDHLARLGVDILYLTPFFPAASNHRYNASSFDRVDPLLGGDEALASLVRAAHRAGIRVMGDLTTNHTGDTHEWFLAAQADRSSPEASFYYFFDEGPQPQHGPRGEVAAADGPDYEAWFAIPSLPKLDHASPELRRRMVEGPGSVVARWLEGPDGLDGWRIDVANMTGRRADDDHNHEVARAVRRTMDETKPDSFLLAEHFHDTSDDVTTGAGGWDAVMNYAAFTRPVWEWLAEPGCRIGFLGLPVEVPRKRTEDVVAAMRQFAAAVPWHQALQNVNNIGSHDTPRARTVFGSDEALLVGAALLVGYPGIPMVFAGDELGLEAEDGEHARTPMPWDDDDRFAGAVLEAYAGLLGLRRRSTALRRGGMRWLCAGEDDMAWLREAPGERVAVVVARAASTVDLPVSLLGEPTLLWRSPGATVEAGATVVQVQLPGPGAVVLRCG
ncbi:glycoside hydrolase family 13 protein [Aquipuribacter nitratireducens]|uniref:Glycoside hydrolase family 13 protein n=1 Tax=Aquipuribacter nitratireducens TaxID=650104 RepID=A0ABW0GLQ0_9MICO